MNAMTILSHIFTAFVLLHGTNSFQLTPRQRWSTLVPASRSPRWHSGGVPEFLMKSTEEQLEEDQSSLSSSSSHYQDDSTSGGLKRTLVVAVPLFCKFVIVLCIKFLTDAVVFPLLFLYRLARITKRKIKALFSKEGNMTPPNGEVPPSNQDQRAS